MNRVSNKEARAVGCISAAVVFFVTVILPILVGGGLLWLIFKPGG